MRVSVYKECIPMQPLWHGQKTNIYGSKVGVKKKNSFCLPLTLRWFFRGQKVCDSKEAHMTKCSQLLNLGGKYMYNHCAVTTLTSWNLFTVNTGKEVKE